MKKIYNVAFICVIALAVTGYAILMFNDAVWYDEAYTMAMVKHTVPQICSITAQDVHPPLYYILLKLFITPFGYSLTAAKVFAALPIILTALLGYVKLSKHINKKTGLMFSIMYLFLPVITTFSVEVRMYTLAAFFVTACALYAYEAHISGKSEYYVLFLIFGVLAAYTHYFALVSAGIIYIILFIEGIKRHELKKIIISSVVTVVLYLPWLAQFIMQLADKVENEYWIDEITLNTVLNYFTVWFKCGNITPLYLIITGIFAFISLISLITNPNKAFKKYAFYGALIFIGTNIIGIAASLLVRPVFIERYAVPALPMLLMAIAIGIGIMRTQTAFIIASVFYLSGFGVNYPYAVNTEYSASELELREYLDDAKYEALICYVDAHLYGVLSHYAPDTTVYRPKLSKGSPFDNIKALSEFDTENCHWAALFVPQGDNVPTEITEQFNADYVRTVSTYGIMCDMYNLWK